MSSQADYAAAVAAFDTRFNLVEVRPGRFLSVMVVDGGGCDATVIFVHGSCARARQYRPQVSPPELADWRSTGMGCV